MALNSHDLDEETVAGVVVICIVAALTSVHYGDAEILNQVTNAVVGFVAALIGIALFYAVATAWD